MLFDLLYFSFFLQLIIMFSINLFFFNNIIYFFVFSIICLIFSFNLSSVFYFNYVFIFLISYSWVLLLLLRSNFSKKNILDFGFFLSLFLIFVGGFCLTVSNDLIIIVFSFELIMLPSLYLLRVFSKSERNFEAFNEMFFWSLSGSFFLILGSVFYFLFNGVSFVLIDKVFLLIGFFVKVPIWPMGSWLLKAHVEASTEFSIFLSGFLVKFGVIGLFKLLFLINNVFIFYFFLSLSFIGLFDSVFRLFTQVDLKKIVAITTLIETNWLLFSLCLLSKDFINVGLLLILVHTFTTTIEFYIVDFIYKRYGTRNLLNVNNLSLLYPNLFWLYVFSLLIIIGLPGTSIFLLKFIFFINLISFDFFFFISLLVLFFFFMPVFFIRLFLFIRGGTLVLMSNKKKSADLTNTEINNVLLPLFFNFFFIAIFVLL